MQQYLCSTDATTQPVTLAEVREHCRIDGHDSDGYLSDLIVKATRQFQRIFGRQFVTATWKLYLDRFPAEILLEKLPVATVTSVVYIDNDGTSQTLAASGYQVQKESPDAPARIKPAYGLTWPSTRGDIYNAVTVTFTAGYGAASAVPKTVKHAIMMVIAHWYEQREPVTENVINEIPFAVDWLMAAEEWGQYA